MLHQLQLHQGFAFVRILQRCPVWTPTIFQKAAQDPAATEILVHPQGISEEDTLEVYTNHVPHDPQDLDGARHLAEADGKVRLGLFYRDVDKPRYEETRRLPVYTAEQKIEILNAELDRYAV